MVVGKSPEWLPPGFVEKVKYKNGRKIKFYLNVAMGMKYNSKKEVICATENYEIATPKKESGDRNGLSIDSNINVTSVIANDTPAWLPNGWIMEERTRMQGSSKGKVYKVYSDSSSGRKFYSKAAVARYLNTLDNANTMTVQNIIDNVDKPHIHEPSVDEPAIGMSPKLLSMTNTGDISNVDVPSVDMSPQLVSMTNAGGINKRKRKKNSLQIDNVDKPYVHEPSVDEPAIGMSPKLLSMTNTDDISNVDVPSVDMSPQLVSMTNADGINKRKKKKNSSKTVATERTIDDDLPPGWIKEIKIRKSGKKIRKDPYYTDPVSGYVFRSKLDALRYLITNDIGKCICRPVKRKLDDIKSTENKIPSSNPADEKLPVPKRLSLLVGGLNGGEESSGTNGLEESESNNSKKKQGNFESDSTAIVEEKILCENSERDTEIRNNPATEIDSKEVSGVLAVDLASSSLITNVPTNQQLSNGGNRTNGKLSKSKKRKGISLPSRSSKRLAGSQPVLESNFDLNERSLRASLRSSAIKVDKSSEIALGATSAPLQSDVEQSEVAAEQAVVGVGALEHLDIPKEVESDVEKSEAVAEQAVVGEGNLEHLDILKEVEYLFNDVEAVADKAVVGEGTLEHLNILKEVEYLFNDVEEPPGEVLPIPEEQPGVKKQIDESKGSEESQLCYDFGDSWSNPLEFAFKTLMGEIPMDDPLAFPNCFSEQDGTHNQVSESFKQPQPDTLRNDPLAFPSCYSEQDGTPHNQAGGSFKQPQSDIPQNESASRPESSKQLSGANQLPHNSSSYGNIGFNSIGGFNCQSSTGVGGKDSQNKFNP